MDDEFCVSNGRGRSGSSSASATSFACQNSGLADRERLEACLAEREHLARRPDRVERIGFDLVIARLAAQNDRPKLPADQLAETFDLVDEGEAVDGEQIGVTPQMLSSGLFDGRKV